MSQANYDHYKVILTGKTLPGYSQNATARNIAKIFNQPFRQTKSLLNGSATVIKDDIPHVKAYQLQQTLMSCGAETTLQRIPVTEHETGFSLVPDGEEQTPYKELAKRLEQGEQVSCSHCYTKQPLGPYCCECGKQLIGSVTAEPAVPQTSSPIYGLIVLGLLLLLFGVTHYVGATLLMFSSYNQWWISVAFAALGILLLFFGRPRKLG